MPYSDPIAGIADSPSQPSLKVFPNPTHNQVTIALGEGTPTDLSLYDIRGNRVITINNASGLISLNLSTLPQGIYILHCGHFVNRIVKL